MIGDTLQGDRDGSGDQESPIVRGQVLAESIIASLTRLDALQKRLELEIADLERRGVYDQAPMPSWENRNGGGRYLRLVFPTDPKTGQRRREYVGADPEAVAAALAQVERTSLHRLTRRRLVALTDDLSYAVRDLANVNGDLARMVWDFRKE